MQQKYETAFGAGPQGAYRDAALDRDRVASMADEGGIAAAETDLREQVELVPVLAVARPDRSWSVRMLVSALAVGIAAAVITQLFSGRRRKRARWFGLG